jgi:hypothetical protein
MATLKQRKSVEALGETGGVISKAMAIGGYAKSVTHATEKLTNSDGWKELMGKHLDDKKLVKVHEAGLEATFEKPIIVGRDEKGRPEYEYVEKPDFAVRHKYLDTAYKLKNKIQPDNSQTTVNTQVNLNFFGNPAIMAKAKELDELIEKQIYETKKPTEVL